MSNFFITFAAPQDLESDDGKNTTEPPVRGAKRHRGAGGAIIASIAAGAVAALVLTLVVFAGDTEATITGGLLLGFGFGWTLMTVWTVRRTRHPQRWAAVPAGVMAGTGAALVVFTPGDDVLTALNWVWPPLLLALTVWIYLQARRSVTGKARWVLTSVIAVLALASLGAIYSSVAQDELAELSANHIHRTVDSTHAGLLEDDGPAAESVRAITEVVASVRTGTPLVDR